MKKLYMKNHDGDGLYNSDSHYEFRLNNLRVKGRKLVEVGRMTEEEYRGKFAVEEELRDLNIKEFGILEKMNKDLAIIIPTYWGHKAWLKSCLESCKKTGYYILVAYDNHFWCKRDMEGHFPGPDVLSLADSVGIKPRVHFLSVGIAWLWDLFFNLKLLKGFGFSYVFSMNGDCIMEKPERFQEFRDYMGDGDIMCNQYDIERKYCGTLGILSKIDVLLDYVEDVFMNQYVGNAHLERRLYDYVHENNLKIVPVKNSAHDFKMPDHNSTWNKIIGYRHLHAELKIRRDDRLYPVEKKYYDFGIDDRHIKVGGPLYNYYKTDDIKYLEEWWGEMQ